MNYRVRHSAPFVGEEEIAAVTRVLRSGRLAQGAEVESFEQECAAFVGRRYAVAVSSGTAALHLAVEILCPGGRVALPSYGCASLINAVRLAHAEPVLCDIGPDFNIDAKTIPAQRNAVIVPHLFGARAELPGGQCVIEDIAQSIGGPTGRDGVVTIVSFYATKLITTGEGGMLLTDDESIARAVRDLRDYDNRDEFRIRFNYKLTELQAALGREQLKRLPAFIARRREIALAYNDAFRPLPLVLPSGSNHIHFRYVVKTPARDALEAHLNVHGIEAKRPVYKPAHHYVSAHCPASERAHAEALSIPVHLGMTDDDVRFVIEAVTAHFR
ncbi:MAG: DegT/DnrJ/EryC1/StrS family aminotransferase [Candidatus Hydrogenedentes bacterium]|nr:DegT/DnrJ/EryC1/StrS family aminotransferase [Candidatus Hydrogenedentota bacterium]